MAVTPVIKVGILSGKEIKFSLSGNFSDLRNDLLREGTYLASWQKGKVLLAAPDVEKSITPGTVYHPVDVTRGTFTLHNVMIGINFHWQKEEDQVFRGSLQLLAENEGITAVNILPVEDYLKSVISSEMSATASAEMLKAHAVISRSWLLAQIDKTKNLHKGTRGYKTLFKTEDEIIRWYDREDHAHFDVCADDHCQRYQGITRSTTSLVEQAVNQTHGEILTYEGAICDARYSKCCGGVTELFENTWEPFNHPYLQTIIDNPEVPEGYRMQLSDEVNARNWILGQPPAFCNTDDRNVLLQVLNDYDQTTRDFFRWRVTYTVDELSDLIKTRTGIDFGMIRDLLPVQRGASGRLIKLKVAGTRKTMTIGKELEIRKALSTTHLYSSAFVVEKTGEGADTRFTLHGAGWGHGVGLCQIGAAVMGVKGYSYKEILLHYFRGAALGKRY
ncbi:MAG TPA: SpoIID/LytB domain-containing protein [Bacteroidales bacterium]|nr:SpoIID/LytB domain-containing protein [Bacteroidales bacterium]